jgi:hypothetical protein
MLSLSSMLRNAVIARVYSDLLLTTLSHGITVPRNALIARVSGDTASRFSNGTKIITAALKNFIAALLKSQYQNG